MYRISQKRLLGGWRMSWFRYTTMRDIRSVTFIKKKKTQIAKVTRLVSCHVMRVVGGRRLWLAAVINANVICCRGRKHPLYHDENRCSNHKCLSENLGIFRGCDFLFCLDETNIHTEAGQYSMLNNVILFWWVIRLDFPRCTTQISECAALIESLSLCNERSMQRGLLQAVMATPRVCGDHSSFPFDVCFRTYHSTLRNHVAIRLISYMWVRAKDIVQRAAEPPSRRTKTSIVGWLRWKQQCHTAALCNMAALTPPPLHSHCHSPRLKRLYGGGGSGGG